MPIRFACPNGHVLSVPDNASGQRSRCPECQVELIVPAVALRPKDDSIVFLCPNGHRLNGPRRLEGKAGKCPHCGAKFRIPSSEDPREEEPDSAEEADDSSANGSVADAGGTAHDEVSEIGSGSGSGSDKAAGEHGSSPAHEPSPSESGSRGGGGSSSRGAEFSFDFLGRDKVEETARGSSVSALTETAQRVAELSGASRVLTSLFDRVWLHRQQGAIIEVHLADGDLIVPEKYAASVSRGTHAVFAVKDHDGTHTLTIVPWESVSRVAVRRITTLPADLFD